MGQLERLVAPFVPELSLDTNAGKSAEDETDIVIGHLVDSQNSSSTIPAQADTPQSSGSPPGFMSRKIVSSTELLEYARSAAVPQVAVDISPYMVKGALPMQRLKAIIKVNTSKLILVQQILFSTRGKLVSAPQEVNDLADLRSYMPKAMSFILTSEDDPVRGMLIPTSLSQFASSFEKPASDALWTLSFNHPKYNLHKIRYMVDMVDKDGEARDTTPPQDILFGDHTANARMALMGDKITHGVGFDNDIYTLLLQPAQEILLKMQGSPKDDEHGVKMAVSCAIYNAHQELHIYWQVARTTDSPQQGFPFNGHSLVEPDGPYSQRFTEIRGHIRSGDHSLFRNCERKQQKVLQAVGTSTHSSSL